MALYQETNAKNTQNELGYYYIYLSVTQIRYTQDTISDTFSDGTPLQRTIDMLKTNKIKARNIPPIRVALYRGHYRTIDNRRLYCFKRSNIKKISVKCMHPTIANSTEFHKKNTSKNDGQRITVRNASKFFYCDICDTKMTSGDKVSHLNGRRHHQNTARRKVQNVVRRKVIQNAARKKVLQNEEDIIKKAARKTKSCKDGNAKKSNCVRDKAIITLKPKICNAREIELEQIISQKTMQIKKLNTKLKAMESPECKDRSPKKLNCVEDVTVAAKCFHRVEMKLEQIISEKTKEINALNSKLKEMKQEINDYKIRLKDMEVMKVMKVSEQSSDIAIDIGVELNEERKKNGGILFAPVVCCVFVFGGLCLYLNKYI